MDRSVGTILVCPECDSSGVKRNVCTDLQGPNNDVTKYACEDCRHKFDEYDAVYRERKIDTRPRKDSVARSLLDADPDDLATDGGSVQGGEDETGARSADAIDRIEDLLEAAEQHLAVMKGNGMGSPYHLVETTTFDNHRNAPGDYEGHTASIGKAEALCGQDPFGRMLPESVTDSDRLCGNCLRSVRSSTDTDRSGGGGR